MSKTDRPKYARNKFSREEKDRKRSEAETRQAIYNALTPEQKLAKLDAGGFTAAKQRIKIQMQESFDKAKAASNTLSITNDNGEVITPKDKKGAKARKQAKKDKKASK